MRTFQFLYISIFVFSLMPPCFGQQSKCNIIHNGIDLQTKLKRIELGPQLIFNYSPPEVKNTLQEGNLMECTGQIVQVENDLFFNLNIRLNSLLSQERYGSVESEALLKIILIDGKELELSCYAGSKGVATNDGAFIYAVGYNLSKRTMRQLMNKEIDKFGIQWTSGYEEYTIYEVDVLQNQIACLNRATQKPN